MTKTLAAGSPEVIVHILEINLSHGTCNKVVGILRIPSADIPGLAKTPQVFTPGVLVHVVDVSWKSVHD